ncbi:SMI1/KNR4 family protein [Streptomyces sp. NPDC054855]
MTDSDDFIRVQRAWQQIAMWMERHAPASRAMLNPPASPARIAQWEAAMGFPLPPALRALYLLHDGSRGYEQEQFGPHPHAEGPLPAQADGATRAWEAQWAAALFLPGPGIHTGFAWFPLDEVTMQHPVQQGIEAEYDRLIPFAADTLDSSMSGFFLDPQDGQLGTWGDYGQVEFEFGALVDYVEQIEEALNTGGTAFGYRPAVHASGALGWPDSKGDPFDELGGDGWTWLPEGGI